MNSDNEKYRMIKNLSCMIDVLLIDEKNNHLTMNQDLYTKTTELSSIRIVIRIEELWISRMIEEQKLNLPINDQYTLTNLKVTISEGLLNFKAEVKEKEGTTIEATSSPHWDKENQRLQINDLKLKTDSNNLLLKSAGWLAQTFLGGTIDKKLEEQANKMYIKQLEKLKEKPIELDIPIGGKAKVTLTGINVHELAFLDHAIGVTATVDSHLFVHLSV